MRTNRLSVLAIAGIMLLGSAAFGFAADTALPPAGSGSVPSSDSAPPSPDAKSPPPKVTIIGAADAHGILGSDVRSTSGEDMGRINDVIVDRGGKVLAAVIDFGGFLGVGSRKIVVDWDALLFGAVTKKGDSITLDLTREQVKAAPEYAEDKTIVVLGKSGNLSPLDFGP